MKRFLLLVAVCALAAPASAADPADDVRRAEIAFAKAFADRDAAAFFGMVLEDASFLSPVKTLGGKAQVKERWSRFFQGPKAPFSWGPERVAVNAAGTVGLSTGPVYAGGKHVGNYSSVWLKQADGSWKILFDGPGSPPACLAAESAVDESVVDVEGGAKVTARKFGSGPYILLVPSGGLGFEDLKQLGDLATVIGYEPRKDSAQLAELEAVRRHYAAEKVTLLGEGSLAPLAARYAAEHPEHVARLVLVSPKGDVGKPAMPVLVLRGAKDAAAPPLADARTVTLRGGAPADDPVNVFGPIRQFLRGEPPLGAEKIAAR